jgi:ethanolamine utilization protein EutA
MFMNAPTEHFMQNQIKQNERLTLLGLDFGSTTSSALIASTKVSRSSATGHMQLDDVQVIYKSEPVFTPFIKQSIDTEKVSKLITNWLEESGVSIKDIFSGGSMITGLAAQADNATALSKLIINMVGESVIATADDPCLESWLAFMGSCGALSRFEADTPIINFDIGGGTTNVALGVNGDVQQTGCYFIGARHFQFVAGSYQLTAMSSYGEDLLESLNINKKIGETLDDAENKKIISFYIKALEGIVTGDAACLSMQVAKTHTQVAIQIQAKTKAKITFSGGVGELIYKISAGETLPTTTFYGDFGIDLALAISRSALLSNHLKSCVSEHKGRATVVGLTLHSTEITGNTVYLPNPDCLPLRDLPIIAKIAADAPAEQWQNAFTLAAKRQSGTCIQIDAGNSNLAQVRVLASKIKYALQASIHAPSQPMVILVEANIGKALGNYISNWGQLDYNLIVIDEVALRDAHFVYIGRTLQGMIPVSFYGLN